MTKDVVALARSLSKSPGFSLIVIGTLALGIGANAALFRPLAIADEGRVVFLQEWRRDKANDGGGVSYPDSNDWRTRSESFSSMAIGRRRVDLDRER